ncbi:MAG: NAD(+) diphosphatase [Arachnia sp.]
MTSWTTARLDRRDHARDDAALDRAWADATVLAVDGAGAMLAHGPVPVPISTPGARTEADLYLGRLAGTDWFARMQEISAQRRTPFRGIDQAWSDLVAMAAALAQWHWAAPRCEQCQAMTSPIDGGARRRCGRCGALVFPRQDPAVIVAVLDQQDRLVLARQASWPPTRFSLVAGFVEAGESAEQAVQREVAEEVGLTVAAPRFVGSQPWPAPRSLMLGFVAQALSHDVTPDGVEIVEAAFYERSQAQRAIRTGELSIPGPGSIAHRIINEWLAGGASFPPSAPAGDSPLG